MLLLFLLCLNFLLLGCTLLGSHDCMALAVWREHLGLLCLTATSAHQPDAEDVGLLPASQADCGSTTPLGDPIHDPVIGPVPEKGLTHSVPASNTTEHGRSSYCTMCSEQSSI